jgi:hypothetical protein
VYEQKPAETSPHITVTQIDLFKPTYSEQPKCWKFTTSTTDVAEQEEIVLSVQGIITHMDLPPFKKR